MGEASPLLPRRARWARRAGAAAAAALVLVLAAAATGPRRRPAPLLSETPKKAPDVAFPPLVTEEAYLQGPDGSFRTVSTWTPGFVQGPTRRVALGSVVTVPLVNALAEATTSVHHHGVHQRGTPFYDGAVGLTQSGLAPGRRMDYAFVAAPYGTHWYHSHVAAQFGDGLKGFFIVEDPEDPYAGVAVDDALMVYSWTATPTLETVLAKTRAIGDKLNDPGDFKAGLVNGVPSAVNPIEYQTTRNATMLDDLMPDLTPDATDGYVVEVEAGSTARLRLLAADFHFIWVFAVDDHNVTVIAKDGTYVRPVEASKVWLYASERYDVLVAPKKPGVYRMRFDAYTHDYTGGRYGGRVNATLRVTEPAAPGPRVAPPAAPFVEAVDVANAPMLLRSDPDRTPACPASADRELRVVLTAKFPTAGGDDGGSAIPGAGSWDQLDAWLVNGNAWTDPTVPLYLTDRGASTRAGYETLVYDVKLGEVVDIVVDQANVGAVWVYHAMHLHGYKFWVVEAGPGHGPPDDAPRDAARNVDDPLYADTFSMVGGSYYVLRVRFDNPGVWHFHCHYLVHMLHGLQVAFNVAPDDRPAPPAAWYDAQSLVRAAS